MALPRLAHATNRRFSSHRGTSPSHGPSPTAAPPPFSDVIAYDALLSIGETVASLEADEARGLAEHDEIKAVLEVIARDEAAHAALAFRIVAWGLRVGGAPLREAVEALIDDALATANAAGDPLAVGAHARLGILGSEAIPRLRARASREVVAPCARAVLA